MTLNQLKTLYSQTYHHPLEFLPSRYPVIFERIVSGWNSSIETQFYMDRFIQDLRFSIPAEIALEFDQLRNLFLHSLSQRCRRTSEDTLAKISSHHLSEIMEHQQPPSSSLFHTLKKFTSFLQTQAYEEAIQFLQQQHISVNQTDLEGLTPLMHGINRGAEQFCLDLLRLHANPHVPDRQGNTALHWAVINNKTRICEMLLYFGANPNAMNASGATPLSLSAIKSDSFLFQRLYDYYGDVHIQDHQGNTLLHKTILSKSLSNIRLLLLLNVSLLVRNHKGQTPMDLAKLDPSLGRFIESVLLEKKSPFSQSPSKNS